MAASMRSLVFVALLAWPAVVQGQSLKPYVDAEGIHLRAPDLRLLSTEARQRLRNGATVTYAFRVSLTTDRRGPRRTSVSYHCVFSYDLWEEKYKVVRLEPGYRSASHLTQSMAEQLCLESLVLPLAGLAPDTPFWIVVDYQMQDRTSSGNDDDSRTIPGVLIDIFSKRTTEPSSFFSLEGGPFRLTDLRANK